MDKSSGSRYHRNGYTGYGTDPAVHQRELESRMVKLHEIFKPPVHTEDMKFGHVTIGMCFLEFTSTFQPDLIT